MRINKQWSPFGAKICTDICPRTLSVPSSEQFSESVARGKLWASRNRQCSRTSILAYFCPKWRLLCLLFSKSFSQRAQFWKLGNILGYSTVLAGEYLVTWRVWTNHHARAKIFVCYYSRIIWIKHWIVNKPEYICGISSFYHDPHGLACTEKICLMPRSDWSRLPSWLFDGG